MKVKLLKKACAVSLSMLMLTGAGLAEAVPVISTSRPVYAASATPESKFSYSVNSDGTATITGYKGAYTVVTIPSTIDGKKVTAIGNGAFGYSYRSGGRTYYSGYGITSVTIPDTVKKIGNDAFKDCAKLTSVTIPDSVTAIGKYAFCNTNLTKVTIPDSVETIGSSAFSMCSNLKKAVIGNGVKKIGSSAFNGCNALTGLKLGNSIETIGSQAFENCRMTSVSIPASTKEIGNYAFQYCSGLTSAYIENGTIGAGAFYGCFNLKSISLGNGVKTIGKVAFDDCGNLRKIRGNKGSYAETFAGTNSNYKFIPAEFSNESTLSADYVSLGRTVTINFNATMGTLPYTYAVFYKKAGASSWTNLQNYKEVSSAEFKPKEAGNYEIRVIVRDKSDKPIIKDLKLTVMANTSKLGSNTAKLGDKVKVRCFAKGGTGTYKYAVYYKKAVSAHWSKLRDYGTGNLVLLNPAAPVGYHIRVDAKDSSGHVVSKILILRVSK